MSRPPSGGRLAIHAQATTYYVKQLALQAVLDVVSSIDAIPIDLDIDIASGNRSNRPDWEFGW